LESVYLESSVFLAVINGEANGPEIKALLKELKDNKIRIYTSIITVQEIAVLSFRHGSVADDPAGKLHKMARVVTLTKEMALTAAKLEAQLKDLAKAPKALDVIAENRRRKWDCFHIAAAMCLKCATIYSSDDGFRKRKNQLGLTIDILPPVPKAGILDLVAEVKPGKELDGKTKPAPDPISGGPEGPPASSAGAKAGAATEEAKAEAEPPGTPEGQAGVTK
jgi:predicted nucleic acid-binding protein